FFFQAEDGIRDFHVTGVQTCALPISRADRGGRRAHLHALGRRFLRLGSDEADGAAYEIENQGAAAAAFLAHEVGDDQLCVLADRSEERRVGKECRFWVPNRRSTV